MRQTPRTAGGAAVSVHPPTCALRQRPKRRSKAFQPRLTRGLRERDLAVRGEDTGIRPVVRRHETAGCGGAEGNGVQNRSADDDAHRRGRRRDAFFFSSRTVSDAIEAAASSPCLFNVRIAPSSSIVHSGPNAFDLAPTAEHAPRTEPAFGIASRGARPRTPLHKPVDSAPSGSDSTTLRPAGGGPAAGRTASDTEGETLERWNRERVPSDRLVGPPWLR